MGGGDRNVEWEGIFARDEAVMQRGEGLKATLLGADIIHRKDEAC